MQLRHLGLNATQRSIEFRLLVLLYSLVGLGIVLIINSSDSNFNSSFQAEWSEMGHMLISQIRGRFLLNGDLQFYRAFSA